MPFIIRDGTSLEIVFLVRVKYHKFGLLSVNVNLLTDNQRWILESSWFNDTLTLESCIGMKYSVVVNRLVSSAKSINLNALLTLGKSLIYIYIYINGPRIDPCGTPVVIMVPS